MLESGKDRAGDAHQKTTLRQPADIAKHLLALKAGEYRAIRRRRRDVVVPGSVASQTRKAGQICFTVTVKTSATHSK